MGGILIIISIVIPTLLWADLRYPYVWIALAALVGFGWIGFLDDYAKITRQRNLGLTGRRKLTYQFSLGFAFAAGLLIMRAYGQFSTNMNIPFVKQYKPSWLFESLLLHNPWTYVIGVALSALLVALIVVFTSNAVRSYRRSRRARHRINGDFGGRVDHAHVCRGPCSTGGLFAAFAQPAHVGADHFLRIDDWREFRLSLVQRAHPAEIFMGDVGSLGLGGAMAVVAVLVKQEVLLLFIGGIFIPEAVSVILQVGSFKLRHGKRIFKMAPLHHHFEALGWTES